MWLPPLFVFASPTHREIYMGCGGRGVRSHPSGTCTEASGDPGLRAGRVTRDRARAQVAGWPSGAPAPSCPRNCRSSGMLSVSLRFPLASPVPLLLLEASRAVTWGRPRLRLALVSFPASVSPRTAVSLWVLPRAFPLLGAHQGQRPPPVACWCPAAAQTCGATSQSVGVPAFCPGDLG